MNDIFFTVGLGILMFILTNIDDFVFLILLYSQPVVRPVHILVGQLLGISILIVLSLFGAYGLNILAHVPLGPLGYIPLSIGCIELFKAYRQHFYKTGQDETTPKFTNWNILTVTLVTTSAGGDNVGIYIPAFTGKSPMKIGILSTTFLAMTGVWCYLASRFSKNSMVCASVEKAGKFLAPCVYVAVGLYLILH